VISSFVGRLTAALAALLLAFGATIAVLGHHLETEHEQEAVQRLSYGLARHIVEHWPEVASSAGAADPAARSALMTMLMVVNPAIEVYMLDADGRVAAYIGEPGMVRRANVDLASVRAFLAGAPLPLRGTDPKTEHGDKIFSAAMFAPRTGDARPPGYLYVVLSGQAREQLAGPLGLQRAWQTASAVAGFALLATLGLGALALRQLTRPLRRLAQRMHRFNVAGAPGAQAGEASPPKGGDEVATIAAAFDAMALRIAHQVRAQAAQTAAHHEVIAGVAHDLRTPLTALHGHLEALARPNAVADESRRVRLAETALAQSDKVRRLSQQLFELATLQATDHVVQRERFRLDELVADTVQKFELSAPVALDGPPPGRIELDGDLHLIERALTNLIDNAVRHAPGSSPVRVSVHRSGQVANVLVEDRGPGMPAELARRLGAGEPARDTLQRRPGGIGGLGLAIAQRVADLHGGSLRPLPAPDGGTRLCLAFPLSP
jgi:signal transduction histidine kinase